MALEKDGDQLARPCEKQQVLHTVNEGEISYIQQKERRLKTHNLHRNGLLQHVIEGKVKATTAVTGRRRGNISSYWIIIRKEEDPGN